MGSAEELTPVSMESMVESVRLSCRRSSKFCHERVYSIRWTNPDGQQCLKEQRLCGVCDDPVKWMAFGNPTREPGFPPPCRPLVDVWIPTMSSIPQRDAVAVAYILLVPEVGQAPFTEDTVLGYTIEGRIGIRSQWRSFRDGNILPDEARWRSLSERYYAYEGPGVYPVPVIDEDEGKSLSELYGTQLDDVLDAWEEETG